MAQFKQWFTQDLTESIVVQHCESVMFTGDDNGAVVGVRLFDGGSAYSSGGTVSGAVKRSDGGLVPLTGTLSGNAASVVIPAAALAYPGPIGVHVVLTQGGSTTTVLKAIYSVDDNSGAAVDPGTIIPSINDLITAINNAVASIPSDYSALLHTLAPDFSASTAYAAGDYVWYNGTLYRFGTGHAAGSWVGTDATATVIGDSLSALRFSLEDIGHYNYACDANKQETTTAGVTFTADGNEYTAVGTTGSSGVCSYALFNERQLKTFERGKTYHFVLENSTDDIYLQLYKYVSGSLVGVNFSFSDSWITIPSDADGIQLRIRVSNGKTVNNTVLLKIYGGYTPEELLEAIDALSISVDEKLAKKLGFVRVLNSSDDLNTFQETGAYLWLSSSHPTNIPNASSNSIMIVIHAFGPAGFVLQTVHTNSGKMYQRMMGSPSTGWLRWFEISAGSGGGGTTIENTYNITTSPTITTDANGWLQSVDTNTSSETGKTDMTGPIMSMLSSTGYCHLGPGIFYVSGNIDMPDGSELCGCGDKTIIRLLQSVQDGYCVKIKSNCLIKDVCFSGSYSTITPTTEGARTAIRFSANSDGSTDGATAYGSDHCKIDNVWIRNFSGSGILCHNTTQNYAKGLYASNLYVFNCYIGIDIDYLSEFNKFVNTCIAWCNYGCVNNGGNNTFSACTFHARSIGFRVDGTKPNSAHGIITGCTFAHIGSNAGVAIEIDSSTNGFVIDGCQIWYNSLNFVSSYGIVVSNCEFGRGTTGAGATITINGGGTVLFNGCMFMNDSTYPPDITITNNSKVRFNGCYGSLSGNAITA